MLACENCLNEHKGEYASGRFCSAYCARGFSTKQKRLLINRKVAIKLKRPKNRKCLYCDFLFEAKKKTNKYCSRACAGKDRKNYLTDESRKKLRLAGLKSVSVQAENRRNNNEKLFFELCKQNFTSVENNKQIFNGWDADIIIHDLKIAVLWNGKWHYKKIKEKEIAMGFFGKLVGAVVDTTVLPFSAAKDVITLGGALNNEDSATIERIKRIGDKVTDAADDAADGDFL